jgi:hypothetical protein
MIWFGSSAGVAISKDYPEARNTGRYIREGWFVAVAYVVGFFAQYGIVGWIEFKPHKGGEKGAIEQPADGVKDKKPEEKPK